MESGSHRTDITTPHDFRRTARSNTKRLRVDFEIAEAMLNHVKRGLERTYDQYEFDEEKRDWFHRWEQEVINIARKAGVADVLGVPPYRIGAKAGGPKEQRETQARAQSPERA